MKKNIKIVLKYFATNVCIRITRKTELQLNAKFSFFLPMRTATIIKTIPTKVSERQTGCVFMCSSFLIIRIILFVHAREKVKYPIPNQQPPPPTHTPPLPPPPTVPLHSSAPAPPSSAYISNTTRSPPSTLPTFFFSPCLLFTKVWLSISCGLRQQALMKRPLRQGDPN